MLREVAPEEKLMQHQRFKTHAAPTVSLASDAIPRLQTAVMEPYATVEELFVWLVFFTASKQNKTLFNRVNSTHHN